MIEIFEWAKANIVEFMAVAVTLSASVGGIAGFMKLIGGVFGTLGLGNKKLLAGIVSAVVPLITPKIESRLLEIETAFNSKIKELTEQNVLLLASQQTAVQILQQTAELNAQQKQKLTQLLTGETTLKQDFVEIKEEVVDSLQEIIEEPIVEEPILEEQVVITEPVEPLTVKRIVRKK